VLSHLKVLELATILAGPAVGMFFAELGADVVKVENPSNGGDPTRGWRLAEETDRGGRSAYFCSVNWGKRSLALDLKQSPQRDTFLRLVACADILLLNLKPGDEKGLGLDSQTLWRHNPGLIIGSLSGYGSQSPRPGFDALIQAEAGYMAMNGPVGGPPCKLPVALMDLLAAHQLKEGLLLALLGRSGQGQRIEVSLWDSALASLANQATNSLMLGYDPLPSGTEHPNLFPYGTLLPCADGVEVMLAVGTDRQFLALCECLEVAHLSVDYASNAERVQSREKLRKVLETASRKLASTELAKRLEKAAVPAGKLQTVAQALGTLGAGRLSHGDLAGVRSVAFSGPSRRDLSPPPGLGEHQQEVLRDWLKSPGK